MNPMDWNELLEGRGKAWLESEALPAYLPCCRWFGGKSRSIASVSVSDHVTPPGGAEWVLVFLRVGYGDGSGETYLLPLARAVGPEAEAVREFAPSAIVAELSGKAGGEPCGGLTVKAGAPCEVGEGGMAGEAGAPGRAGGSLSLLYEAVQHPDFRSRMLALIASGAEWKGRKGLLRGVPGPNAFPDGDPKAGMPSLVLKAEQSNTSIIFPGRYFMKFLRRLEAGENPEAEILRFFARDAEFSHVPRFCGALEYLFDEGKNTAASFFVQGPKSDHPSGSVQTSWTVAIAEGLVAHERDAWSHTLSMAVEYMDRLVAGRADLAAIPPSEPPGAEKALEFARLLGLRTAEMHLALASRPDLPAFAPEPFTRAYQDSLAAGMGELTDRICGLLAEVLPRLPEASAAMGRAILADRAVMQGAFAGLRERLIPTVRIRLHGDYHLGQVLYTGADAVILDFEGEPSRPMSERKRKGSPWKDVAGMLRSFHYAIHSAWPKSVVLDAAEKGALEPYVELWPARLGSVFLEAYLATAGKAAFVPDERDRKTLLTAYLMEKAVYELGYELNNRPDWAHIPLAGILRLL